MSDDELRALEREASSGDGVAVLRYVEALRRVGRTPEALLVLSAHRSSPAVRQEIRTLAGPSNGSPETASFAPVRPIKTVPRVLWSRPLDQGQTPRALLGNVFGVVVAGNHETQHERWLVDFVDPETGVERRRPLELTSSQRMLEIAVVEDVALFLSRDPGVRRLVAHELTTGDELWSAVGSDEAFRLALVNPGERPSPPEPQHFDAEFHDWAPRPFRETNRGGRATIVVGDSDDSPEVFRGGNAWRLHASPDFAVAGDHSDGTLVFMGLSGETGRFRRPGRIHLPRVVIAEDVAFVPLLRSLGAFDRNARLLWELSNDGVPSPSQLLPLPGRLVGHGWQESQRCLFCFAE